ncbi:hypothetical protein [Amycolatopsis sp. NPDC021455]|uniref:alpha/beta hydrolase family protein n=1 Tax=Amycolatopsis sp. NPDC021455 TaxID=3154901 RepID=UPI0033C90518
MSVELAASVVSLRGRARWARPAVTALLIPVATAQVLVEEPRWQLVPAYVLAAVLVLAALYRLLRPRQPMLRPALRSAAIAGGLLGLAASTALPVLVPVFTFPRPSGPYGIGTVTYHWVDQDRPEIFTADPGDRREVVVQVWYPADRDDDAPHAAYVPDADALGPLAHRGGLPSFTFSHLKYVRTNAVPAAPVAAAPRTFPLLVLATGLSGYRQYDTLGVEELVSHGYVVAGIDHPYSSAAVVFPDGRRADFDTRMTDRAFADAILPHIAADTGFTFDRLTAVDHADPAGLLTGRLDLARTGLFGLSLGGEITGMGCLRDTRFRACLSMDSWMPDPVVTTGLTQPTMWLTRDRDTMRQEGWHQDDIDRTLNTMRAVFDRLPADGYLIRIPGMYHADFGDTQLISPLLRPPGFAGPLDGAKAHHIVNSYVLAFFDRYLRGRPAPLLEVTAAHPDVLFEKHLPGEPTPR